MLLGRVLKVVRAIYGLLLNSSGICTAWNSRDVKTDILFNFFLSFLNFKHLNELVVETIWKNDQKINRKNVNLLKSWQYDRRVTVHFFIGGVSFS